MHLALGVSEIKSSPRDKTYRSESERLKEGGIQTTLTPVLDFAKWLDDLLVGGVFYIV